MNKRTPSKLKLTFISLLMLLTCGRGKASVVTPRTLRRHNEICTDITHNGRCYTSDSTSCRGLAIKRTYLCLDGRALLYFTYLFALKQITTVYILLNKNADQLCRSIFLTSTRVWIQPVQGTCGSVGKSVGSGLCRESEVRARANPWLLIRVPWSLWVCSQSVVGQPHRILAYENGKTKERKDSKLKKKTISSSFCTHKCLKT